MRAVKKEWLLGMLCVLSGVMLMVMHPVQAQAGQADRAAYRAVFDASYYSAAYPDVAAVQQADSQAQQTDSQTGTQNNGTAQSTQQASGTVIGTCTTSYVDNIPRATNVALAAQRINGTVVQPGGSFSFSNTILPRTSANGYVTAPIYVSGKKGTGTGGGVCQVSSTLYAAMVYAGLPATERHAHSLPVDYLPAGLDATIAGSYLDLKFTNTFSQPLLIQASANGGTLTVTLVLQ